MEIKTPPDLEAIRKDEGAFVVPPFFATSDVGRIDNSPYRARDL
jgi:hypothetical protein